MGSSTGCTKDFEAFPYKHFLSIDSFHRRISREKSSVLAFVSRDEESGFL
jgi:hypothetical protein